MIPSSRSPSCSNADLDKSSANSPEHKGHSSWTDTDIVLFEAGFQLQIARTLKSVGASERAS